MAKQKQFEKQFLSFDEKRFRLILGDFQRTIDKVNAIIPTVEAVIKRELTEDEKLNLHHKKADLLMDILRPSFAFPNADDNFNLQAQGLKIDNLLIELNKLPGIQLEIEVKDGALYMTDNAIIQLKESNTRYTQNEKQNKVLKVAKKLEEDFKELEELGLLPEFRRREIQGVTDILEVRLGDKSIKYNPYMILQIRE